MRRSMSVSSSDEADMAYFSASMVSTTSPHEIIASPMKGFSTSFVACNQREGDFSHIGQFIV